MDIETQKAEIEKRIAARHKAAGGKQAEQELCDLIAYDELEEQYGVGSVVRLDVGRYVDGLPTCVVVRAPKPVEYKRFCDMIGAAVKADNAQARQAAQDALARVCWVYPKEEETQARLVEAFPGLLLSMAVAIPKLAEATGKG